jgi:DNA-directed RNA polymerase subunit RPC12/RpoP
VLLSEKLDRSRLLKEGQGVEPTHAQEPEEAHAAQIFACPQCGGRMGFDPEKQGLACESCGYIEEIGVDVPESSEAAEQVLDFVMPTTLAHRWAEAQSRFSCAQCGAVTLLRPGQIASLCPYCGSSQMIESSEFSELVDPHSIAPAQFTGEEAANHVRQWLGRGWFIPDDLKNLAQTSQLRPAYYPFWTFDGTLQMKWSCEVNEGSSNSPNWVMRTGEEYKMFDDVLVLGVRKISDEELSRIEPFQLKELVAFDPKYLAGWVALTYELALADASLEAREKVARELRQDLHNRVLLGQEKRNLEGGGVAWSGMTFKLALLPLWIGSYHYRGKNYRLLVNGQTGKVGGEKPTDSIKVAASIMMVLLALGVLGLLVWGLGLTFGWFSF